jgi:hypothetical protein
MSELNRPLSGVQSGEHAGSATAHQLPDIACSMLWIKAVNSNAGNVYVGGAGVTVVNGTGDATSGFELDAGESLGPLPLDNLNRLYIICDNAGDDIVYFCLG